MVCVGQNIIDCELRQLTMHSFNITENKTYSRCSFLIELVPNRYIKNYNLTVKFVDKRHTIMFSNHQIKTPNTKLHIS